MKRSIRLWIIMGAIGATLLTSGCGLLGGGIGLLGLFGDGGFLGLFGSSGGAGVAEALGSLAAGGIDIASLASLADGTGLLPLFEGDLTNVTTFASIGSVTSTSGAVEELGGGGVGGVGGIGVGAFDPLPPTSSVQLIHHPEPASVALLGMGLAAAAWRKRRTGSRRKSRHLSS